MIGKNPHPLLKKRELQSSQTWPMRMRLQAYKPVTVVMEKGDAIPSLQCQKTGKKTSKILRFFNRSLSLLTVPAVLPDGPITQFSHLSTFSWQKTAPAVSRFGCKCARFGHGFWKFGQHECALRLLPWFISDGRIFLK